MKLLGRGTTVFRLARWAASKQINFKLDGAHPAGASHHQKIVVIDDRLAFCGGIDMTASRWDTREHEDGDERRKRPTTGRRYCPWHDATMAVDGAAARALGDLPARRWHAAGGSRSRRPTSPAIPGPTSSSRFPRRRGGDREHPGRTMATAGVREIEALFVDMIARRPALRLCRKPVLRLAGDRRGDR